MVERASATGQAAITGIGKHPPFEPDAQSDPDSERDKQENSQYLESDGKRQKACNDLKAQRLDGFQIQMLLEQEFSNGTDPFIRKVKGPNQIACEPYRDDDRPGLGYFADAHGLILGHCGGTALL